MKPKPDSEADDRRIRLLRRCALFSEMSDEVLEPLARVARITGVAARAELFHKGDEGSQLHILIRGRMKVLHSSSESGEDLVLGLLGPGDVVGELALLTGSSRSATLEAVDVCELLTLERNDAMGVLTRDARACLSLSQVLAKRLEDTNEHLADLQFMNLPYRLAKKILGLAGLYGEGRSDGVRIKLRLSQGEWGNTVGASRESVNKQLGRWKKAGIVDNDRGFLVVKRPDELKRLARYDSH
jgi:CRP-like cAMP-binding protein